VDENWLYLALKNLGYLEHLRKAGPMNERPPIQKIALPVEPLAIL
jgi:hypothetical protein